MAFEAYLYIAGIPGSSTSEIAINAAGKPVGSGPIEIKSYGLGIEMPLVENRSATGAITVGRANFEDFETAKSLDVATNSLLFYCLSGKHIDKANVLVYRNTGKEEGGKSVPTLYMQIAYEHIVITEVAVSGSGDEMPTETLKFNYSKVTYYYTKTNKKTGLPEGGKAIFIWDRTENSGEKSG